MTAPATGREVAARIGRFGVWTTQLDRVSAPRARDFARAVETLGFGALWIAEAVESKEIFAHAAVLLASTERIVVATGVANIWARDPIAMANGARTLADAFPGRFLLGIGSSHSSRVAERGHTYEHPVARMTEYCRAMDVAPFAGPEPLPPRILAALGPKMLSLAAGMAAGAHSYFVPPEHTTFARRILGDAPVLAVEQGCVVDADADRARAVARSRITRTLTLPNYRRNLQRLGWGGQQMEKGGDDELVDRLVVHGTPADVGQRVRAHLLAGADHVCLQLFHEEGTPATTLRHLDALAPVLHEIRTDPC